MKNFGRKTVLFAAVVLMLGLAGCRQTKVQEKEEIRESDGLEIGMTFDSFIIERWQRDRDVFVSAAQELGAQVDVQNANGEIETQIEQIDYFIKKNVDAIVVVQVATDGNSEIKAAIERAKRAKIPVIAYDRLVLDADVDLYISFDNEEVGRLMGEHMKEHLGDEAVLLQICGPLADNNVSLVMSGFSKALEDTDIQIARTEYAEGWLSETGFTAAGRYLNSGAALDGVMCGNDSIAGQAIRALSERRLAGQVCVVGQDADLDACQRIVEGTQCMTVYKPVEKLARRAAELAVQLARGEAIETTDSVNDGSWDVPYERLEPVAVTKENMDEVITGKYHEESDIYLNVQK